MPRDLRRRLTLLTFMSVLIVGGLAVLVLHELSRWDGMAARLARESLEASLDGIFHSALTRATGEAVSFTATGNQDYAREATDALLYAQSAMAQLRRLGADRPPSDQNDEIRKLREAQEELLFRVRREVAQALRARPATESAARERLEKVYGPELDSDRTWLGVVAWHDKERRMLSRELRAQRQRVVAFVAATVLAGLIWAIVLHTLVVRQLATPLRRLAQHAQSMAEGEPDPSGAALPTEGDIGIVHEALERIARRLHERSSSPLPDLDDSTVSEAGPDTGQEVVSDTDGSPPERPRCALLLAADPAERDLTRAMLQHSGLTVRIADDAGEAAKAIGVGEFDLLVVDAGHFRNPATDALMRNRPNEPTHRRLPVILLSGEGTPSELPDWFVEGVDAHLKRPIAFFDLHAALARALGER